MVPICIEFQAVDSLRIGYTWIVLGLELISEIHMLITLLGKKLNTGAVRKNANGISRCRISSYIRTREYVHGDRLLQ